MIGPLETRHSVTVAAACVATLFLFCACAAPNDLPTQGYSPIDDLQVVNCELPDRVKRIGNATYLSPRPPKQLTAAQCRIQGGEYVAYDRADYRTALNVWLPVAEQGDPDAQANVGEIYEQGLGGQPNYEMAALWYGKAAEAGNDRARFNLATLYEKGLGVPQDRIKALNLYRQAWGLSDDDITFQSLADEELQAERRRLEEQIEEQDKQIEFLRRQLAEAEQAADAEIGRQMLRTLENQRGENVATLDSLPAPPVDPLPGEKKAVTPDPGKFRKSDLGAYHALIIGNQNYLSLEDLSSPLHDADRVREVLEQRYGFKVQVVTDADRGTVMQAIADLSEKLAEDDNLLIYYAGHGARRRSGDENSGYWLPVEADPPPDHSDWVSTRFITDHLKLLPAKRVLIVADSCYAEDEESDAELIAIGNETPRLLEIKQGKKSRLLLASGHESPVTHEADDSRSIFADAFVAELQDNDTVLSVPGLYTQLLDRLGETQGAAPVPMQPRFTYIRFAGHELGDFFFVPTQH